MEGERKIDKTIGETREKERERATYGHDGGRDVAECVLQAQNGRVVVARIHGHQRQKVVHLPEALQLHQQRAMPDARLSSKGRVVPS
jgi:hypothetical protein